MTSQSHDIEFSPQEQKFMDALGASYIKLQQDFMRKAMKDAVMNTGAVVAHNPTKDLEDKVEHLEALLAESRNRIDVLEFMLSEVRDACPKIAPGRLATDKQPELDCDNCNLW